MPIFIGVDVGTSSVRCCAIDEHRTVLGNSRRDLPLPDRQGNKISQHPDIWYLAMMQALDDLFSQINPQDIARLTIDGTSSTLLLCQPDGTPLTTGLMYNDSRAVAQLRAINRVAPEDNPTRSASSSLAKLLHLLEREKTRPVVACHQADWLIGKLTGVFTASDENNALKLGYDCLRRQWPDWLSTLALPENCLPKVFPAGTPLAKILPAYLARWNINPETIITTGTTDSTAGFIATGANNTGTAVTSLGSTLVLKVLSDQPVTAPAYGVYSHRLGDQWLVGGASNTGGAVLKQHFSSAQLQALSAQINPEISSPLSYYPLPATGERFPINDPTMQSSVDPRPASDVEFLHGLLQGIANIEQQGYALLADLGAPYPLQVMSVGGGAKNKVWGNIRNKLLG
ncbi:MAG: FGGY-family carbohydrate kinase, partial [Gammaproteobacteria bacterium]